MFNIHPLIWLIPLPPLLGFVLIVLFTRRSNRTSHNVALVGSGLSFVASMVVFFKAVTTDGLAGSPISASINWLPTGADWLRIGVLVDPLTAVMLFFVAWTVLMIFIYSIGYHNFGQPAGRNDRPGFSPEGAEAKEHGKAHKVPSVEPMYARFFALLSLFAFAMYLLVVSDNLLTLYIGWEIMGFCSYFLIGFWYGKESARKAGIKAFITTRIGDVFMLLGMVALYSVTGTLNFHEIFSNPQTMLMLTSTQSPAFGLNWAGLIGLLLFCGTVGKSAQFPLHVWLPDAMEGPTPVSAMIHAATMVSAGVYLSARLFPLMSAGWHHGGALTAPMAAMAVIGGFTALFTSTIALAQHDIKRVLAYSTISQLGYMIAALGIGAYTAAVFHLVTHAFFKALLFLGSGSVIHGMEHGVLHTGNHIDPQDMRHMGGLRRRMPLTFWTFLAGGLALSGFPLITAGFWSKDEILNGTFTGGHIGLFIVLAITAFLTAFYTARQITLVFFGKPRSTAAEHAHETKPVMTVPLMILAIFAIGAGWAGIPHAFPVLGAISPAWFQSFIGSMLSPQSIEEAHSNIPLIVSVLVSLGGLLLGWLVYRCMETAEEKDPLQKISGSVYNLLQNKYWIDELYQKALINPSLWLADKVVYQFIDLKIIDGILHGLGRAGVGLGNLLRAKFDLPVVNGAGDGLAGSTRGLGVFLHKLQNGRVQTYLLIAVACTVVLVLVICFLIGEGVIGVTE
ncbi:MAG TPA: NADH-quinone oxidoreductase subunit L [Anaerolineaceae bacterium]|nr:NADH-quinone oxidoreductase subunit L [Anaerolineaceae bacterium]